MKVAEFRNVEEKALNFPLYTKKEGSVGGKWTTRTKAVRCVYMCVCVYTEGANTF